MGSREDAKARRKEVWLCSGLVVRQALNVVTARPGNTKLGVATIALLCIGSNIWNLHAIGRNFLKAFIWFDHMVYQVFCVISLAIFCVGCNQTDESARNQADLKITLGMSKQNVLDTLAQLQAIDKSAKMQTTADAPKSNWMWTVKSPDISLETRFENDKLVTLNIWDWRGRKQTSYHHTMRYDEIESLVIRSDGTFETEVIKVHNPSAD
jgi:hypothetical protein